MPSMSCTAAAAAAVYKPDTGGCRISASLQVVLSLGIVVAQWINLGTELLEPWGWRLSLALAGLPAIVLTIGGIALPDTPNSLVERGKVFSKNSRKCDFSMQKAASRGFKSATRVQ